MGIRPLSGGRHWNARHLRAYLRHGGLIAYPTRGVFGLGCDPDSPRGLQRLLALKGRNRHKGFIVVDHDRQRLGRFHTALDPSQVSQVNRTWPGPHTWLMPARPQVSALLRGRRNPADPMARIALRCDDYPPLVTLCRRLKMALVSTSANRSGQRALKQARPCRRRFGDRVRVIDGRTQPGARPSIIQDLVTGRCLRS